MPEIFVFGGSNGSGKSTLADRILSSIKPKPEFVNADLIAAELCPEDVDSGNRCQSLDARSPESAI